MKLPSHLFHFDTLITDDEKYTGREYILFMVAYNKHDSKLPYYFMNYFVFTDSLEKCAILDYKRHEITYEFCVNSIIAL